ncbi:hypothetical protein T492DRAFT_841818 [Pavlovales sp. CCMP2436]|nr:hypothetical protein T492DRAFT_841818 [Pavlovales sp. CCMP2436]
MSPSRHEMKKRIRLGVDESASSIATYVCKECQSSKNSNEMNHRRKRCGTITIQNPSFDQKGGNYYLTLYHNGPSMSQSGRSRRYEYADFPGEPQDEDSDGGGFNVDTIVMQNQHSARGIVLCPDTNHYMGHFSATIHETKFINTDDPEDVNVGRCVTPYLVKLFIQKKQKEFAANKRRREILQEMKDAADM